MVTTVRACALGLILSLAAPSLAEAADETIVLSLGVTSILNLDTSFETVMIGDPNVVDVHTRDNRSVILEPLKIGAANVIFLNKSSVVTANVRVFVCGIIRTKYREGSDCE
jgi:Flp pilus assembly secretin CpaC